MTASDENVANESNVAHFTAALLKVASRCNLDCDYCYVYHHVDQTWRNQPAFMSSETLQHFSKRLNSYVCNNGIAQFSIIFHGGEPLLFSAEGLVNASHIIRDRVVAECELDFSIQTNGHLLTDDALQAFEAAKIGVSLSLDGPRDVNDMHRLDHRGRSTFDGTFQALQLIITSYRSVFHGVIAVIDPSVSPKQLFEFFSQFDIPRLDLLLPDATHVNPPIRSDHRPDLFRDWLVEAFELWYTDYSDLPIRFFDAILASRLGVPSPTDVMGFGTVNLVVIETDGTYTDHDVFKIAEEGINQLGGTVASSSLESIAEHPRILEHAHRLSLEGVAAECKTCPVLEACGGGSVVHRYHAERGLEAPTVYCSEMFSVMSKATDLLANDLIDQNTHNQVHEIPSALSFGEALLDNCDLWRTATEKRADDLSGQKKWNRGDNVPAAAIFLRDSAASNLRDMIDFSEGVEAAPLWMQRVRIQSAEQWLIKPFEDSIRLLATESAAYRHGVKSLSSVQQYFSAVSPILDLAVSTLISDILFVESTLKEEKGIFSFSDDSAPNVIYVAPFAGDKPLASDDIADSILHEFLHQVLYHIELSTPLLFDYDFPRFPAPWRSGLRPAGGFLHGTFVFSGLALFWKAIANAQDLTIPDYDNDKAEQNAKQFLEQATYGLKSSYNFALLTPAGKRLVEQISILLSVDSLNMQPPGVLEPFSLNVSKQG